MADGDERRTCTASREWPLQKISHLFFNGEDPIFHFLDQGLGEGWGSRVRMGSRSAVLHMSQQSTFQGLKFRPSFMYSPVHEDIFPFDFWFPSKVNALAYSRGIFCFFAPFLRSAQKLAIFFAYEIWSLKRQSHPWAAKGPAFFRWFFGIKSQQFRHDWAHGH